MTLKWLSQLSPENEEQAKSSVKWDVMTLRYKFWTNWMAGNGYGKGFNLYDEMEKSFSWKSELVKMFGDSVNDSIESFSDSNVAKSEIWALASYSTSNYGTINAMGRGLTYARGVDPHIAVAKENDIRQIILCNRALAKMKTRELEKLKAARTERNKPELKKEMEQLGLTDAEINQIWDAHEAALVQRKQP